MKLLIDLQAAQACNRARGIGRYALSLTEALLRQAAGHEVWVALNAEFSETIEPLRAAFDSLIPQSRIVVWKAPTPASGNDPANDWRRAAGEVLRESFLASLDPDIVYVASPFEGIFDGAVTSIGRATDGGRTAASIYDLIPLSRPDLYLSDPVVEAAYQRKIGSLRRAGLWLPISEWSRREAIEKLDLAAEKTCVIAPAAHARFGPIMLGQDQARRILSGLGLTRPFVLYTGGGDPRKNMPGLIGAFAALPAAVRSAHQLAIVCAIDAESSAAARLEAARSRLEPDALVLTGFVSDDDLVALYNLCRTFCFPSLVEGFGLPALEAMQCGAPTIGSDAAAIPEAIGRPDALFDPLRKDDISERLHQVLTDEGYRSSLVAHGLQQARTFSWEKSAARAWAAFELHQKELGRAQSHVPVVSAKKRPRLAYISPLPPEKSGIAEYSAELLPELSRHYDIDVVVSAPPVADSWVAANCPARAVGWFDENAHLYDRILYHFGNSTFHRHMFDLLRRHPGVVVLHDFYLSGIVAHMDLHDGRNGFWPEALYRSHGYPALSEWLRAQDNAEMIWKYPANLAVLQNALGLIVHNEYCRSLGERFFRRDFAAPWQVIPQLRGMSQGCSRQDARAELGFAEQDFVVCSFGVMGPIKRNQRLLQAWLESDLAGTVDCHLIFVGEDPNGQYSAEMQLMAGKAPAAARVHVTGFVTPEIYRRYLSAADAAVQLRTLSRGETSRAVLDCMAHGLPLIVNAHGALKELPNDCVIMLAEEIAGDALRAAIEALRADAALRARLGESARRYVKKQHSPRLAADRYFATIEEFSVRGREAIKARAVSLLAGLETGEGGKPEFLAAARALHHDIPPANPQHALYVDISELVRRDVGTGVQRMVRSALTELMAKPPAGFRIEPVYATLESRGYRYARAFTARFLGCTGSPLRDAPLDYREGDLFLGLDLQPHVVPNQASRLAAMRDAGVAIYFVVHDLLPVLMPQFFTAGAAEIHERWLSAIARFADGLIAVSQTVADELIRWLDAHGKPRSRGLRIGWIHHGADLGGGSAGNAPARPAASLPEKLAGLPLFLMVGTIEPRKGHAQALAAFELLWAKGVEVGLVVAGRQGWMVEKLLQRLRTHRERDRRLVWLDGASDEELEALYGSCTCLLVASEGEGFGLPLVEAARHGLPVLARDLGVFREIAGPHARYFRAGTAEDLSSAIADWLQAFADGKHEKSDRMPWLTWAESAERLKALLLGEGWYACWPRQEPPNRHCDRREGGGKQSSFAAGRIAASPPLGPCPAGSRDDD